MNPGRRRRRSGRRRRRPRTGDFGTRIVQPNAVPKLSWAHAGDIRASGLDVDEMTWLVESRRRGGLRRPADLQRHRRRARLAVDERRSSRGSATAAGRGRSASTTWRPAPPSRAQTASPAAARWSTSLPRSPGSAGSSSPSSSPASFRSPRPEAGLGFAWRWRLPTSLTGGAWSSKLVIW